MPQARSSTALGLAPLILRVALGITFVWAGLGKWMGTISVKGEDAAVLANMGAIEPAKHAAPAPATSPAAPLPSPRGMGAGGGLMLAQTNPAPGAPTPVSAGPPLVTAGDFPEPVACRAMWMVALRVHQASHPGVDETSGNRRITLWPRVLGEGLWPKCIAWAVVLVELLGGASVLIGLFTRLGALAIAMTMLGAIWLDQLGPAIQGGRTMLGFLPDHALWDEEAWRPLLWQMLLVGSAFALALLGSGALAVDRALAGFRTARASAPTRPAQAGGPRAGA